MFLVKLIPNINDMTVKAILPFFITAILLTGLPGAWSQDEADFTLRPDAGGEPTIVTIRVIVLDLDDISGASQTYTANIAYQARWQDDRLIHEGPGDRKAKLSEIWHPGIQILNRQRLQETFEEEAHISPSGEVEIVQRVWGQFSQPLELHDFPFDHQVLEFNLVGAGNDPGTVKFVEDAEAPSRIADTFPSQTGRLRTGTQERLNCRSFRVIVPSRCSRCG